MAEAFKNQLNKELIEKLAVHFQHQWPQFDAIGFVDRAAHNLEALALKERSNQITQAMLDYLPADFADAGKILLASLGKPLEHDLSAGVVDDNGIAGWAAIMPMTYYVGLYGQAHFELSMRLFKEMTKRGTSEFGIRLFLVDFPDKTLAVLNSWTDDTNEHVRRLVSEGIRPRLPWAMQLPLFIENPTAVIELLEKLKDDESEYVRRSVANNLNDIAKDHPDRVAKLATQWMKGASENRKKLIRHACRTLLKKGHKDALQIFDLYPPEIKQVEISLLTETVVLGGLLQFSLLMDSAAQQDQSLMIDYIIHHQKANGSTSAKVFKWRSSILAIQQASKKWTMPIRNWKMALNRFMIEFEDRLIDYI